MQSNEKSLEVIQFEFKNLPAYAGAKERQEQLVKENPFVEITDAATYAEAKKRRTALRQGRYELQNGQKLITQKINEFKKDVEAETLRLINITKEHEEAQQEEIIRFDAEKERLRQERAEKERARIHGIMNQINAFKATQNAAIENASLGTIKAIIQDIEATNLEVEEFGDKFQEEKTALLADAAKKLKSLEEYEEIRKMREEAEAERKRMLEEKKALELEYKKQAEEARLKHEAEAAKMKEERLAIEKEKAAIAEQQAKIKAQEEAEARAKAEAAEKLKKEEAAAKVKAEAEKRQAELRPDKEKIVEALNSLQLPKLKLNDATMAKAYNQIATELTNTIKETILTVESL